jgi:hypothetical protein
MDNVGCGKENIVTKNVFPFQLLFSFLWINFSWSGNWLNVGQFHCGSNKAFSPHFILFRPAVLYNWSGKFNLIRETEWKREREKERKFLAFKNFFRWAYYFSFTLNIDLNFDNFMNTAGIRRKKCGVEIVAPAVLNFRTNLMRYNIESQW